MKNKTQEERRIWLIRQLQKEMPQYRELAVPNGEEEQWRLLRSLFNVRPPYPVSEEFLRVQDAYLTEMIRERGIVDGESLPPSPKRFQNLPLAGRYHKTSLRRHRKCGQQRPPRVLAALPFLHR